jgi:hypothetical protein
MSQHDHFEILKLNIISTKISKISQYKHQGDFSGSRDNFFYSN